jgi:hypothetical protein
MTDEQWEKIRPFSEAEFTARRALEAWGATNASTERERLAVHLGYQRAQKEYLAAQAAMKKALREAGL